MIERNEKKLLGIKLSHDNEAEPNEKEILMTERIGGTKGIEKRFEFDQLSANDFGPITIYTRHRHALHRHAYFNNNMNMLS